MNSYRSVKITIEKDTLRQLKSEEYIDTLVFQLLLSFHRVNQVRFSAEVEGVYVMAMQPDLFNEHNLILSLSKVTYVSYENWKDIGYWRKVPAEILEKYKQFEEAVVA